MTNVIANLQSLQFESGLSEDERNMAWLRTQTHSLAVAACAQITYLASTVRDAW